MIRIDRRNIVKSLGVAAALAVTPAVTFAQSGDPVTLVVPYGGGGLIDGLVREVGEKMAAELDQPVVVENKPGSNGIIGANYAASARPDGLTYFVGATGPLSLNVMLRQGLPFSMDSFEPVGTMMSGPLTVTVPAEMGVNTIDELKAYAEDSGKPLRYATLGPGSVTHLFGMVLQGALNVPMIDVAYRDNPSMIPDLLNGQNDLNFSTPISLIKYQDEGSVKILAISSPERNPLFADIPTTTELGYPELVSSFWFGLLAPAGTPQDEIARVSAALQTAMSDEALQERMIKVGLTPQVGGVEAMQEQLDWDKEFWGGVIEANEISLN
ncbi:Bug family tripartite tricarboxylate transporter substrate binding protein [Pseudooceanicola sediminis]|uniref:Bug family tripartite tricarboxylate transporter substrate binding protein n=1 Tax=Pseudooceanicola sediminis TaxID=2211117 RepID=UPI001F16F410|nr:tripartite tricarboxylate transporter substrate binding protein [Pseudooceanicola sediminis]|tara:strand:- start:38419 stop:39396 length:978 start_codon:yes stop_codon:yes gene_type:complete